MANKKITELNNLQTPVANTQFVAVDVENDETKSVTLANLISTIDTNENQNVVVLQGNVVQLVANIDVVQDNVTARVTEDTALQSRLTTNVTALTNEDTALQARITANNTLAASNDFITFTRLNANVDIVQDNVTAVDARVTANTGTAAANDFVTFTRLNANINVVSANVTAVEARRVANIAGAISTVTDSDLTVSRALASDSSGKISVATTTLAELNHVNGVTGAIQTQLDAVEARRAANNITTTFTDDVIVTGNLTVNGATTTINTTNMDVDDTMIMLANGTTGSPANDIGILFNRGDEGNAAFFYDESSVTFKLSDTKDPKSNTALSPVTAANLSVGILEVGEEMTMVSTDDGSSANPVIILDRQSASPADADYLGRIQFKGKDDGGGNETYAQISGKIIDASAGTEDGAIEFSIRSGGSSVIVLRQRGDKLQLLNGNELSVDGDASFLKNADIDGNLTIGTNSSNTVSITGSIDLGALS